VNRNKNGIKGIVGRLELENTGSFQTVFEIFVNKFNEIYSSLE
jgi:hypothetical protein